MFKTIKQLFFIMNVFFIVSTEFFNYILFNNYSSFIDRLTSRLANINILYVKVFQAIALNNSLIDDKINNTLLKFTDNAQWSTSDIRLEELIEISNDYNLIFKDGYEKPINSGMISLVYKAYHLHTAQPVIIKMKRNKIEQKLNDAIDNLIFFMYILSFIPIIHKYQITEVIKKNINIIQNQTDFSQEVKNIIRIKKNCEKIKYVKIPSVYENVTNKYPNFIVD